MLTTANRFKEGREDVNDDTSPGRPYTSTINENIEAATKIILDNRQYSRCGLVSSVLAH